MPEKEYVGKSAYQGAIASRYDEQRETEPIWEQEQTFVEEWVRTVPPGATVLDIPAGTGRFIRFFLDRNLKVLARDISPDMLAEIHRRFDPLPAGLDVAVGDAEQLDLPDDSTDLVISWRFLHLIPPAVIGRVVTEYRRVCRGTIILQVFGVRPTGSRRTLWRMLKDFVRPAWRKIRPASVMHGSTPWSHITSYPHRETELLKVFAETGLIVEKARTLNLQDGLANRVYFLTRTPVDKARLAQ